MKMPALQFYPADWRKDPGVQSLGYFERGVWFEMLCMMHESEQRGVLLLNGLPMPEEALANALGLDNQNLTITLTKLLTYGVARRRGEDGAIFNKRMVDDEKLCKIRREAGKKGGNPALLNQNPTTKVNQNPTPSSSSSSSTTVIKESKKKARTQLPDNFEPTQNHQDFAHQNNLQIGAELSKFRFHHEERVTLSGNWNSSFSKWLSNAIEFRKPKKQNGSGRVQDAKLDVVEQIMGGLHHETKRQTRDITPGRTIESNGARIPETPFSLRKPDAS